MKCYIIMYDLRMARNYEALYSAIQAFGTWGRITDSTWAVLTTMDAPQLRDHLLRFMDNDDRLFVIKSSGEAAWKNTLADNQWLQQNIPLKGL